MISSKFIGYFKDVKYINISVENNCEYEEFESIYNYVEKYQAKSVEGKDNKRKVLKVK